MKKRKEFLCTTAIFSGILLLLLGILFAAVLSGDPGASVEEQAAALGWMRAGQVNAVVGAILFALGLGLRLWMGRQPRQRRRPRGTGCS